MKKKEKARSRMTKPSDVVRLEDLAPRKPVRGGTGRRIFGEPVNPPADDRPAAPEDVEGSAK